MKDRQQLIDSSIKVDDYSLRKIRLGRNKFLKLAGGALFGVATGALLPKAALAANAASPAAAPYPCIGYDECSCCYREACCVSGCTYASSCGNGSGGMTSCWWTTASNGGVYQCCDWRHGPVYCICSSASVG